jgi:hypothetical protein
MFRMAGLWIDRVWMKHFATTRAYFYLATCAATNLIHGVLPTVLPIWLLGAIPSHQYATLLIIEGIAQLVATLLLSPASDRYGPASVLLVGECCFAGLLGAALLLVSRGISDWAAWASYFMASGVIKGLLFSAQSTVIVRMTPAETLERVLGWEMVALTFGRLAGPALAALALAAWTPAHALAWVTPAWIFAWLIQVFVLFDLAKTTEKGQEVKIARKTATALAAGMRWIDEIRAGARQRFDLLTERWLLLQAAAELLFIVPAFGFGLALAIHRSDWPASTLGWAQTCCGAGLLAAHLSGERLCKRYDRWRVSQVSGYLVGFSLPGMAAALEARQFFALCGSGFAANVALGIRIFCGRAHRRVALPRRLQARFAALHGVANALAAQAGNAWAAVVCQSVGVSGWYVLAGAALLPLTLATRWIPAWRELLALSVVEAQGFYRRRWPLVCGADEAPPRDT